jgi:hypothetical protein
LKKRWTQKTYACEAGMKVSRNASSPISLFAIPCAHEGDIVFVALRSVLFCHGKKNLCSSEYFTPTKLSGWKGKGAVIMNLSIHNSHSGQT